MALKLYINDTAVDMLPDENVILSQDILGVSVLDASNKTFSKDFTIPCTELNNYLLQHYENKDNYLSINPNKKVDAVLEIDNVYSIIGSVEVLSVTYKKGQPSHYTIVFYGKVSNLKAVFSDTTLDLVDWTDFEFEVTYANVRSSWDGSLLSGKVYVPIISWVRWYIYDGGSISEPDDIAKESTGVLINELRVALNLMDMIKAIGTNFGLTFTFDTVIEEYLTGVYVVPSRFADKYSFIGVEDYGTDVQTDPDNDLIMPETRASAYTVIVLTQENSDPQNRWTTSKYYTPQFSGTYSFEITFSGDEKCRREFWCVRNSDNVDIDSNVGSGQSGTVTLTVPLTASTVYRFEFVSDIEDSVQIRLRTTSIPVSILGEDYSPTADMPIMLVSDFLGNFLKTYNLLLIETGTNTYEFIDTYTYIEGGTEINLDDYVDLTEITYNKISVNNLINFRYKEGEDYPNNAFREVAGRSFGELKFIPDVDYSEGSLEKESIFSVFPPSLIDTYSGGEPTGHTDLWHHFQLTDETPPKPVLSEFLLMYRNSVEDTEYDWYLQSGVDGSGNPTFTVQDTWPRYSQVQTDASSLTSNTLSYSMENPFVGVPSENTATTVLFLEWLYQQYSPNAYYVEISFPINFGIYIKLTTARRIMFGGHKYYLGNWTYSTGNKMVTLKLYKITSLALLSVSESKGKMTLTPDIPT